MVGFRRRSLFAIAAAIAVAGLVTGVVWYVDSAEDNSPGPYANAKKRHDDVYLDQKDREYLWDVEHHGNLLAKQGFPLLAKALKRGDRALLTSLLSADFRGEELAEPKEIVAEVDFARVVRREHSGKPSLRVDRKTMVDRFLEFRGIFQSPPEVKLALMNLSPTKREDLKQPWEGTCMLRMWGATKSKQPSEVVLFLRFRIKTPTKENLAKPAWIQSCGITQSQVARAPRFLMREVAGERGIDNRLFHDNWKLKSDKANTGGVYLCDFNRDGILDVLITDLKTIALYQGLPGGKFRNVTRSMGLPVRPKNQIISATAAAFVDIDGDGWEDLILGDRVYRNMQGKKFDDYTSKTNLKFSNETHAFAVADYDRDGRMDIYQLISLRPKSTSWLDDHLADTIPGKQTLWRNKGNWQFEDVTASSGTSGGNRSVFSAVWLDANNDGWPDLYVINEFGDGALLINQKNGKFRPQRLTQGPGDFGSMGVICGDFDNDGQVDIYVANMYSKAGTRIFGNLRSGTFSEKDMTQIRRYVSGSQLYRNRGNLKFEPVGQKYQVAAIGWAYGAAMVDLDNDGFLDLFATCGFLSQDAKGLDG